MMSSNAIPLALMIVMLIASLMMAIKGIVDMRRIKKAASMNHVAVPQPTCGIAHCKIKVTHSHTEDLLRRIREQK